MCLFVSFICRADATQTQAAEDKSDLLLDQTRLQSTIDSLEEELAQKAMTIELDQKKLGTQQNRYDELKADSEMVAEKLRSAESNVRRLENLLSEKDRSSSENDRKIAMYEEERRLDPPVRKELEKRVEILEEEKWSLKRRVDELESTLQRSEVLRTNAEKESRNAIDRMIEMQRISEESSRALSEERAKKEVKVSVQDLAVSERTELRKRVDALNEEVKGRDETIDGIRDDLRQRALEIAHLKTVGGQLAGSRWRRVVDEMTRFNR